MEDLYIPGAKVTTSCENPTTQYADFPGGLRLIYREGRYVGWYLP